MPAARASRLPPLLPEPRRSEARPGRFALRPGVPLVLGPGADDRDGTTARELAEALGQRCGVRPPVEGHARTEGLGPRIELVRRGAAGEAYRLEVTPERVLLEGEGPAGLRWAAETCAQLVDARGRIPACRIEDAPELSRRGVMLDVSRGKVPTAETLRHAVDRCARLKLNVLMLYVEHTFAFRRHPEIGGGHDPLEAETLRELDAYAAARGVELVPSLQSLGHMEHVLCHARYAPLAESDARWSLCPADPGTYTLLSELYAELLPNFRSPLFNANCDEPVDLPKGRSAPRAAEIGAGGVYLEHLERVRDLAREHGRRTLVWGDVVHTHPECIPEIDRELVLLDWWYEADHDYDRVKVFRESGLEFWVCPGTSSWNCLFPRMDNALANIAGYAAAARRHGAAGLLVTDWGDFGHYNLLGNSWLGIAWAAQQAWSGDVAPARFDRAFGRALFGDASGEAARLYRELGGVHDTGFRVFNASPLQFLFFDDLDRGYFVDATRPGPLRRSLRRLERLEARLAGARDRFGADALTWEELRYAAAASLLAVRKTLAGRAWLAWRRRPAGLDARGRRRLARELAGLAEEQAALRRELRQLWLRRSRPSDFAFVDRRLRRSIASLRRAARRLTAGRPPPPPPPHPGITRAGVLAALRQEPERTAG